MWFFEINHKLQQAAPLGVFHLHHFFFPRGLREEKNIHCTALEISCLSLMNLEWDSKLMPHAPELWFSSQQAGDRLMEKANPKLLSEESVGEPWSNLSLQLLSSIICLQNSGYLQSEAVSPLYV